MPGYVTMKRWRYLILGACLWLCGCASAKVEVASIAAPAKRPAVAYGAALGIGHLDATGLTEASGLTASRQTAGLLWAVNDSGNAPLLYALGPHGEDLGAVRVANVENIDWEDLACFTWQGKPYLLVADVGDNRAVRDEVQLHMVPEPLPDANGRFSGAIIPSWSIRLRFEDGPRDCEAVAVDEQDGQVWLLSKRTRLPILYRVPLRPDLPSQLQTAVRVNEVSNIPVPDSNDLLQAYGRFRSWPTGLDMRADGGAAVILTYKNAYFYLRQGREPWAVTLARSPQILRLPGMELLPQREAICFAGDDAVLVTSEGAGAALYRLMAEPDEPGEPRF